ncbi:MAG: redoxin domain-containing protein [Alphaproteobacteria bacterium]|nr:redoxin domain-containing protein [Alphaproteobacteria bacterium]
MTLMIGAPAPNFTGVAILPGGYVKTDFELDDHINARPAVLFFYSMNFSYVCPTELLALDVRMAEFDRRKCHVVAVSTDSYLSHQRWTEIAPERGGIGPVRFPIVADASREIARSYEVLVNGAVALRATFLIDRRGMLRHMQINDFPIGRNIDELLRTIDAMQHHEQTGRLCPGNWRSDEQGIEPTPESLIEWIKGHKAA